MEKMMPFPKIAMLEVPEPSPAFLENLALVAKARKAVEEMFRFDVAGMVISTDPKTLNITAKTIPKSLFYIDPSVT